MVYAMSAPFGSRAKSAVRTWALRLGGGGTNTPSKTNIMDFPTTPADVEAALRSSGALLEGHFLLASGRHSGRYIEKFRLLEQPRLTSQLCGEIARRFAADEIACVVGPVTGGIILAFEVARHLGCRAVYAERDEEHGFALRRGFVLQPGERALVVEDVVTTGGSLRRVVEAVTRAGGDVVGAALLVDRSGLPTSHDLAPDVPRVEALLKLNIASYAPDEVPDELQQRGPAVKPGSSNLANN